MSFEIYAKINGNSEENDMQKLDRITFESGKLGGKPCIRGMRVTVGTVAGLVAAGHSIAEIREEYPYLEHEDVMQSLAYAAWRTEEVEYPIDDWMPISNEIPA
jgi:uncharacterized protein (DUF433 family)